MEGGQEGARQKEECPAEALWMGALGPPSSHTPTVSGLQPLGLR